MAVICENCGGSCIEIGRFTYWVSYQCENCKMNWAIRPDKNLHEATLRETFGEYYDAKIKEYKKRIEELTSHAAV